MVVLLCCRGRPADMTNPAARQCPARWHDHRRHRCDPSDAWQRPDPIGIEIGSGENAAHPGHRTGGRGIDAFDNRMPVGRAKHDAVQLSEQRVVIHISSLPGQKPAVFEAVQRTPDVVTPLGVP